MFRIQLEMLEIFTKHSDHNRVLTLGSLFINVTEISHVQSYE